MSEGTWTPIFYSEDRYFTFKLQTLPRRLGGAVGAVISEAPTGKATPYKVAVQRGALGIGVVIAYHA